MTAVTVSRLYVDTTATSHGDIDHIAVERVVNADTGPRPRLTQDEQRCAAQLLHQHGVDVSAIANRLRLKTSAVCELLGLAPQFATPRGPAPCGTRRGYQQHRRKKQTPCAPCRTANTEADRRLRSTGTTLATGERG
jgi:hypothetical protein